MGRQVRFITRSNSEMRIFTHRFSWGFTTVNVAIWVKLVLVLLNSNPGETSLLRYTHYRLIWMLRIVTGEQVADG